MENKPYVLIVEDKDTKFDDILATIYEVANGIEAVRAKTLIEAEDGIEGAKWALLVLDISMDINGASRGGLGGGHANLGGLDILDTMFYHGIDVPTVIVTGFDYFPSSGIREDGDFIGIRELEKLLKNKLQHNYLGCVRYQGPGWQQKFREIIRSFVQ